jgi:hypothetical protein
VSGGSRFASHSLRVQGTGSYNCPFILLNLSFDQAKFLVIVLYMWPDQRKDKKEYGQ